MTVIANESQRQTDSNLRDRERRGVIGAGRCGCGKGDTRAWLNFEGV